MPIHEKDMGTYERFAWGDALAIAELLAEEFGAATARKVFEATPVEELRGFEQKNEHLIGDFIQKAESHRLSFLNRISQNIGVEEKIWFISLALLGVLRAKAVMELRDRFRCELAPGRGNRVTTASLYDFSMEFRNVYVYSWPEAVFQALGHFDDDDDDD